MSGLLRKYATPLCIGVFVLIGFTGSIMFFGVKNHDLVELHEKIGICFVVLAILHLVRNWKSFGMLLRQKANPWIIGVIAVVGLSVVLTMIVNRGPGHGSPIRGQIMVAQQLAHQPLEKMAVALDMDKATVMGRLVQGGVKISSTDQSLADVAASSGWQVGQLFLLLTNDGGQGGGQHQHRHRGGH